MTEREESALRTVQRAAAYPEVLALVRGLVARYGGSVTPELTAARGWLERHCRGCGVEIDPRKGSCAPCLRAWQRHTAPSNQ